jgi:drug/metabolite transporter (DMT)-like permease
MRSESGTGGGGSSFLVYGALLSAVFFWGLSFVWTKMVFEVYRPFTVVVGRMVLSGALLFLTIWLTGRFQKVRRGDWRWFWLLAFFEPFCYLIGESYGLMEVSASVASLIVATVPLLTLIVAPLFARESLRWPVYLGAALSFLGICLVVLNRQFEFRYSPFGIGSLFFAVLAAVGYNLTAKRLTRNYGAMTIVAMQNSLGAALFLPLFLSFELSHFLEARPTGHVLVSWLELALFSSTFAFVFFIFGVSRLGVARANIFVNLIPVVAMVFSILLLGEPLDAARVVGLLLVLGGVVFSNRC